MTTLPQKILIIGRPNVGKSTFINRLIGRHAAITLNEPGITRDVAQYWVDSEEHPFIVMDSGGLLFQKDPSILQQKM